jgi:hypothetical protein
MVLYYNPIFCRTVFVWWKDCGKWFFLGNNVLDKYFSNSSVNVFDMA